MEKFKMVSTKQLKKMTKGEAYDTVISELNDLVRYYFRFAVTRRPDQDEIFGRMTDMKNYARYIKHGLKEDSNPFPEGFNFILAEFLQRYGRKATENEDLAEVCVVYSDVLDKICKRRAKNIAKDLDMPKDVAMELAVIYPGSVLNRHNAWVFNRALSYRLNGLQKKFSTDAEKEAVKAEEGKAADAAETKAVAKAEPEFDFADKKLIKNLYKGFFGKDDEILESVYSNLMLDRQSATAEYNEAQKRLWSIVTEMVLDGIEKLPVKSVKRIAENYVKRRSKDAARGHENDPQRRVVVSNLEYDRSPKLVTVFNPKEYSFKDLNRKDKKGKKKDKKKGKGKKKKH